MWCDFKEFPEKEKITRRQTVHYLSHLKYHIHLYSTPTDNILKLIVFLIRIVNTSFLDKDTKRIVVYLSLNEHMTLSRDHG